MSIASARIIIDGLSGQSLERDEFVLNSNGTWSNDYYNLANADDLANVAFSGSYNDLSDKPTIDSSLSFSSTNAVENQEITNTIYDKNSSDDRESGVNIEFSNPTLNPYVHIGSKSGATKGNSSVGIGYNAESSAVRSVAIGPSSKAASREGVALGANATAGQYSLSIGYYTNTVPNYSTAVGPYAKVLTGATNATAIGYQSEANEAETISVGKSTNKRRIVNVADGTTATDAATVGQIPTKTSDLTNDSNYVTDTTYASANSAGVIKIGNNLSISNGVLSATGGASYTAGSHIDITNNVIKAKDYVHSESPVTTGSVTPVVTNSMIATGTITADKFATGEVLKLTLSTTDIGEGAPLAENTLYGVYE